MNQLIFFFMGFAACFGLVTIYWQIVAEDYDAQIRFWRYESIKLEEELKTLKETSR